MQVDNNSSIPFSALHVSKDVKEILKHSNITRKELEFLKDAKNTLKDTEYFHVTMHDRDSFTLEAPSDVFFGSYVDNIFGVNKLSEGFPNVLNIGCDGIKYMYSVMRFSTSNSSKSTYLVLGNRGSLNDSIYDLPEVARVAKSLDNAAKGLYKNNQYVQQEKSAYQKNIEKINKELDILF